MEKVAEIPNLWYSEENRLFIRNTNSEFEKALMNLPKQTTEDVINKYKTTFSYLAGVI